MSKAKIELIAPSRAQELLAKNTRNRGVRQGRVEEYARQMAAGLWRLSGETIKIGTDGTLIDGQHRLLACIESGCSFECYVVRDLDPSIYDVIDSHAPRRPADSLKVNGCVNAALLASALNWIRQVEQGGSEMQSINRLMTSHEALELLDRHPGILEYVSIVVGNKGLKLISKPSIVTACYYLFGEESRPLADHFMEHLSSGTMLEEGDPILVLRNRLVQDRASLTKLPSIAVLALFIKAWQVARTGKKIKQLAWKPSAHDFPSLPIMEKFRLRSKRAG